MLRACIKASSQKQYQSNKSRVEKAGYEWSVNGLVGYFTDEQVACRVGNGSCYSILSTYKLLFSIENEGQIMNRHDENYLRMTLRSRKNYCPDLPRIVGAITLERLQQLHIYYEALFNSDKHNTQKREDQKLSEEDYQDLVDASTLLYCCALRIFQLRSLTADSFWFSPSNDRVAWVSVPAKVTRQARFSENKLVHEDFRPIVEEILQRRGKDNTLLFPRWVKLETGSDSERIRLESLMKRLNQEAADLYDWPYLSSFHGTHNFRHGAAQDAFAKGGTKLVMMRTGHLSKACAQYYARSDLERDTRHAFASLKLPKQKDEIENFLSNVTKQVDKMRQSFKLDSNVFDRTFDEKSQNPNLAIQEEQEFEQLAAHCRRLSESINIRAVQKKERRRNRTQDPVNVLNLPEEDLIVPLSECVVRELIYQGNFLYYYVPKEVEIPQTCSVDRALFLIKVWLRDRRMNRLTEHPQPARQDLLYTGLFNPNAI